MTRILEVLTLHVLITCILICIVGIAGIVGNLLMIRAYVKYRKLRTDFYTLFTFLSMVDILFIVIMVPDQIMVEASVYAQSLAWCKASNYLINVCSFITASVIVVLSVLRGILLTSRNAGIRPTPKVLIIVCIVFSIIAALSSVPIINMYTQYEVDCVFVINTDPIRETWLMNAFAALVPCFLAFVIYLLTYLLGKRFFADSYSPREREKSRLVTIIIIAFIVCQFPYRIAVIYDMYEIPRTIEEYHRIFTIKGYLICLLLTDKAIRPVLYSKLASDLSEAFDEVINCKSCSKSYVVSPTLEPRRGGQRFVPTVISSDNDNDVEVATAGPLVDRTISTSSSASCTSATSQTPLTREQAMVDIELR